MSNLAVIYKKHNDGKAKFYTATYVSKNNSSIVVEEGILKGKSENDFGILRCNSDFLDLEGVILYKDKEPKEGYYMYIFLDEYIREYSISKKMNIREATIDIIKKASSFELSNSLKTNYSLISKRTDNSLTNEEIEKMLNLHGLKKDIKASSKSINNLALPLYALCFNTNYDELIKEEKEKHKALLDTNINVKEIINEISGKIIEQDKTIKTVVCNIYFNQKLIDSLSKENSNNELDSRKVGILLDGATGVGKTALANEIAAKFNLPIVTRNANSFSETGYVGATITDVLADLLKKANGDLKLAERGIVFLDEVDKIAKRNEYDSSSMKLGVQKELLGFMSGGTYDVEYGQKNFFTSNTVSFNTSKLTFIFAGAFTDMKDEKIKENNKNTVGFNPELRDKKEKNTYSVDTEDYVKFGLMREFFGRIKVISHMKTYTREDLKRILFESNISPLKGFEKTCIMFGYEGIDYDDEFIDAVVDKAYKMGTNARALQSIMSSIQNMLLFDLETKLYDGPKVKLDKSLLDDIEKEKVIEY